MGGIGASVTVGIIVFKRFGNDALFADAKFVGKCCYGKLTDTVNVKAQFVTRGIAKHYEALKITLINRNEGEIDSVSLSFKDIWGKKQVNNPNFSNGINPYLWEYNGELEWYVYQPSPRDFEILQNTANEYLEVFREPIQTVSNGMSQQMG